MWAALVGEDAPANQVASSGRASQSRRAQSAPYWLARIRSTHIGHKGASQLPVLATLATWFALLDCINRQNSR